MSVSPPSPRLLQPLSVPHKLLMGPGPSNAPPRVLAAAALPLLGHLHPEFQQIMNECKAGIQYAFQTQNPITMAISGTGHAAMEAAVVNLVEPGDVVTIATNGIWGERFADMVGRHGGVPKPFSVSPGSTFTLEQIEEALRSHQPQALFITHGESSSCTLQPLEGIGALCHKYSCLLVVDSVAAMGAVPLFMDKWEIDVLYSGSQKVLSCPPGTSPISVSQAAWEKIEKRQTKVQSFYLDFKWLANYWGCDGQPRRYHHTGPISSLYTLREGLSILAEEGLTECWERHKHCADLLHAGIEKLGLNFFVKNQCDRLPTVTGVVVPSGLDWKQVTDYALKSYKVEIAGGLGPSAGKIWRIGLMGYNAREDNVCLVLRALEEGITYAQESTAKPDQEQVQQLFKAWEGIQHDKQVFILAELKERMGKQGHTLKAKI